MSGRTPAILGHAQTLYDAMLAESQPYDKGGHLYTGYLTETFGKTGLATPAYTKCLRLMRQMECVTQIERGARGKQSVWHLRDRPTEALYADINPEALNGSNELAKQIAANHSLVMQQIRSLTRRVSSLEGLANELREQLLTLQAKLQPPKE